MNRILLVLIVVLAAAYVLTACTPTQLATTQSIQASPLYDHAQVCKRFYLDTRCGR